MGAATVRGWDLSRVGRLYASNLHVVRRVHG